MEDKELERILQEKADQVKVKDFSVTWAEIKDQMETQPVKSKKKFNLKKWLPTMLASAVIIICVAFTPLIIKSLKPTPTPEELFYSDELNSEIVLQAEMISGLSNAQINHVDLSKYTLDNCKIAITDKNEIKGATFDFCNDEFTVLGTIKIYAKDVKLSKEYASEFKSTCKVNSADVYYQFNQENSGIYEYSIYAVKDGVQYVIEYKGLSNNILDFFNEFFA